MNISTTDAFGLYTKALIDVYKERLRTTKFLSSFFPTGPGDITPTLEVAIEVERGFEFIAKDVARGSDGNRNIFGKTTEKLFIPPYFREYWDLTGLTLYDRLAGQTEISDKMFAQLVNDGITKTETIRQKIERTYEKYCAEILEGGTVTFYDGSGVINYNRKAESIVDVGGDYFATTTDPFAVFEKGCTFIRTVGKSYAANFNAILGSTALTNLFANAAFKARQNYFNMKLDDIKIPARNAEGAAYHGRISCGTYTVDLWSYPQFYDVRIDANTVSSTPYLDAKLVTMIPEVPRFKTAFAAVPQLPKMGGGIQTGSYIYSDYTDEKRRTIEYHVESAGLPIPVAVDQIYTFRAVAA